MLGDQLIMNAERNYASYYVIGYTVYDNDLGM
jgi:hypothetical protein